MHKKIKIISFIAILSLLFGYIGFYYWTKFKFLKTHQEIVKTLESKGFTIQENTPLTFSGFPFKLIAYQEKFQAMYMTEKDSMVLMTSQATFTSYVFKPLEWHVKGRIHLKGQFTPNLMPYWNGKLTQKDINFNAGFNINVENHPFNTELETSTMKLKFQSQTDPDLESITIQNFKAQWSAPKSNSINYEACGKILNFKQKLKTNTPNKKYRFTFKDVEFLRFDESTKRKAIFPLSYWKLKIKMDTNKWGKYLDIITKDYYSDSFIHATKKLTADQQSCLVFPVLIKHLNVLEHDLSLLKIKSLMKRDKESLAVSINLKLQDNHLKVESALKAEQVKPLFEALVYYLTLPSPDWAAVRAKMYPNTSASDTSSTGNINKQFDYTISIEKYRSFFENACAYAMKHGHFQKTKI